MIMVSRIEDPTRIYNINVGYNRENLLVYQTSISKWVKLAIATNYNTSVVIGVITNDSSNKVSVELIESAGEIKCLAETNIILQPKDDVFLSAIEEGKITNIAPSITGQIVMRIGVVDKVNPDSVIITTSIGEPIEL